MTSKLTTNMWKDILCEMEKWQYPNKGYIPGGFVCFSSDLGPVVNKADYFEIAAINNEEVRIIYNKKVHPSTYTKIGLKPLDDCMKAYPNIKFKLVR